MNWIKTHKKEAAIAAIVFVVIIYLLTRSKGSAASGYAGILAQQNAGQLQMAQLNAQLEAQGQQTQEQLNAQEIAANAQVLQQENQIAGSIVNSQLIYGNQKDIVEKELANQAAINASLAPYIGELAQFSTSGKLAGHQAEQQTILNELALLLAEGAGPGTNPNLLAAAGSLPLIQPGVPGGFGVSIPGVGSFNFGGL